MNPEPDFKAISKRLEALDEAYADWQAWPGNTSLKNAYRVLLYQWDVDSTTFVRTLLTAYESKQERAALLEALLNELTDDEYEHLSVDYEYDYTSCYHCEVKVKERVRYTDNWIERPHAETCPYARARALLE